MDRIRAPPTVGVIASLLVVGLVAAPYVLVESATASGLDTYYGFGLAGPWAIATGALVATIAFAAGRQDRTDPETAAGATLVVGVLMAVLALQWALAVPSEVVLSLGTEAWLAYHRWAVLAATAVVAASAGWYVRALGLV